MQRGKKSVAKKRKNANRTARPRGGDSLFISGTGLSGSIPLVPENRRILVGSRSVIRARSLVNNTEADKLNAFASCSLGR